MKPHLGQERSSPAAGTSPWRQLSGYQWLVLVVAWLGWVFDSMDSTIYALVMTPALKELLGPRSSAENIGWHGGVIFAVFVVGWALGGIIFGVAADYLGRARTLHFKPPAVRDEGRQPGFPSPYYRRESPRPQWSMLDTRPAACWFRSNKSGREGGKSWPPWERRRGKRLSPRRRPEYAFGRPAA